MNEATATDDAHVARAAQWDAAGNHAEAIDELARGARAGPTADDAPEGGTRRRLRSAVDHQRSEFLRRCRARIKPAEVGLVQARHTRTGGLRREDVAALSGVSVSWYTWLEQGRDIRVSDDVLERLCHTLKLTEDERTYLFSLVQKRLPRVSGDTRMEAPADVMRMIDALNVPAIALNLCWDVLAWNAHNTAIYRDYAAMPVADRNLLEILLLRPVWHMTAAQMETTTQRMVARLRFDYSKCPDDPRFEALVRRLSTRSPLFNRMWRMADFTLRGYGMHRFTHSRFGVLAFEHASVVPDGQSNLRIVICTPANAAAKRAVAKVSAEKAAAESVTAASG